MKPLIPKMYDLTFLVKFALHIFYRNKKWLHFFLKVVFYCIFLFIEWAQMLCTIARYLIFLILMGSRIIIIIIMLQEMWAMFISAQIIPWSHIVFLWHTISCCHMSFTRRWKYMLVFKILIFYISTVLLLIFTVIPFNVYH